MKRKIWLCTIKWHDSGEISEGMLITNYDDLPEGYKDDDIFFYGLDAEKELGNEEGGEFVILEAIPIKFPSKNIPDFISKMDWGLLKLQKEAVLHWNTSNKIEEETSEGLLSLIDAIQDYAVDELGIPEKTVFGNLNEKEDKNENKQENN